MGGFEQPRLFVDGCDRPELYRHFCLPVTCREPDGDRKPLGNFGNWWASMVELYCRNSTADRYVLFEDDIVCCQNLRQFLEQTSLPAGYWNLYTCPQNERLAEKRGNRGWFEALQVMNDFAWPISRGLGALGLMFDRDSVCSLISSQKMSKHAQGKRGNRRVDGAISTSLGELKIHEFCHYPSLLQHKGVFTSILGNPQQPPSRSFPGEEFDALSLLENCAA